MKPRSARLFGARLRCSSVTDRYGYAPLLAQKSAAAGNSIFMKCVLVRGCARGVRGCALLVSGKAAVVSERDLTRQRFLSSERVIRLACSELRDRRDQRKTITRRISADAILAKSIGFVKNSPGGAAATETGAVFLSVRAADPLPGEEVGVASGVGFGADDSSG